ncbi:MAG: hypothetical protein VW268_11435 [Rhodospirillaceae bacterium]
MRFLLFAVIGFGLAACAQPVIKNEEITIEHPVNQFGIAELKADDHCKEFGRRARHVQTTPSTTSVLFFQSSLSTFECVIPKPKG